METRGDSKWDIGSTSAALFLFAQIVGVTLVSAGTARAEPAHVSGHAVEAPGNLLALSGYLLQPPDGGPPKGDVSKEDTTEDVPSTEPLNPPVPPPGGQPPPPPGFGATDTTRRTDSLPTFQSAPIETIGAQSMIPAVGSGSKTAPSKRGILGLHPTALIAALVALHIVVVGLIVK